jgi:hypothetical protein
VRPEELGKISSIIIVAIITIIIIQLVKVPFLKP